MAARGAGPYGRRVQASSARSWRLDGVLWSGGGHGGVARAGLRVEVGARAAGSAQPRSCENKSSAAASPFWPLGSVLDAFPHRAHRNSGLYRRSRGSARSAVSTLVRLILNQTPLGGLGTKPGTRGRPRRDRYDVCEDLRGTTAPPGCPRLPLPKGVAPCESPRSLTGSAGPLYRGTEAWTGRSGPRSGLREERRAETGAHTSLNPRRRRGTINIDQT